MAAVALGSYAMHVLADLGHGGYDRFLHVVGDDVGRPTTAPADLLVAFLW
jgi:hypothetical protein